MCLFRRPTKFSNPVPLQPCHIFATSFILVPYFYLVAIALVTFPTPAPRNNPKFRFLAIQVFFFETDHCTLHLFQARGQDKIPVRYFQGSGPLPPQTETPTPLKFFSLSPPFPRLFSDIRFVCSGPYLQPSCILFIATSGPAFLHLLVDLRSSASFSPGLPSHFFHSPSNRLLSLSPPVCGLHLFIPPLHKRAHSQVDSLLSTHFILRFLSLWRGSTDSSPF